jgi:hypothetical protein
MDNAEKLELDSLSDWKPVEFFQERSGMAASRLFGDKVCCIIL